MLHQCSITTQTELPHAHTRLVDPPGEDEQTAGKAPYRLLDPIPELSAGNPAAAIQPDMWYNISTTKRFSP